VLYTKQASLYAVLVLLLKGQTKAVFCLRCF